MFLEQMNRNDGHPSPFCPFCPFCPVHFVALQMQTCRQPVFGASATLRKVFGAVMNHSIEWYKVTNLRLKMVRFVKNQCNFAYCTLSKYTDVTVIPSMSTRFVTGIQYTSVISSRFRLAFVAPFCHLETFPETQNCRTGSQAKPCSECSRPFSNGWFRSVFLSFTRPHTVGTNMAQTESFFKCVYNMSTEVDRRLQELQLLACEGQGPAQGFMIQLRELREISTEDTID